MFKGFNITSRITEFASLGEEGYKKYFDIGDDIKKKSISKVRPELEKYIDINGIIDGEALQQDWFPEVVADVFISHSHKDVNDTITLAGWLKEEFGLEAFIDSAVWGYANELLKQLDDKMSWIPERGIYSYEMRNNTTSHVHMMLSMALTKMIDRSEVVFFYNTPNSINSNGFGDTTFSPWIYNEITMTKFIQKRDPGEHRKVKITESSEMKKAFNSLMQHRVDLDDLIILSKEDMNNWYQNFTFSQRYLNTNPGFFSFDERYGSSILELHPLDVLYKLKADQIQKGVNV